MVNRAAGFRATPVSAAERRAGPRSSRLPALLPGLLVVAAGPVQAKPAWIRSAWTSGTFVYANLCTAAESGTRIGQRVTLRRSPNGDGLTYEDASHAGPMAAGDIALDDADRTLRFAVETGSGPVRFQGVATADALTGTFEDETGTHPVRLPRVLRSHAHEACAGETTGSLGQSR